MQYGSLDAEAELRVYQRAKTMRSVNENEWRMASAYCMPRQYGGWVTDGPSVTSSHMREAARRVAYDTTGVRSLPKYVAVLMRMLTPMAQRWHQLTPSDNELKRSRRVKLYFDEVTGSLFHQRYLPMSRFEQCSSEVYGSIGCYGIGPAFIGKRRITPRDRAGGVRYKASNLRDVYILTDENGDPYHVFRRIFYTVDSFKFAFPGESLPPALAVADNSNSSADKEKYFEFVHSVRVKFENEFDPQALDNKRYPVRGRYLCVEDRVFVGEEEGFNSLPYLTPRTYTEADNPYGFAPAAVAMGALGTASATKKSYLKAGQRATDHVLLAHDDGSMNGRMDLTPGRVNFGAVNANGNRLVHVLEPGRFQPAEAILADERSDIEDSFFVKLFEFWQETPQMTATEVIERLADRSALLAPAMARMHAEWLGPLIQREIEVLTELGMLPPPPPELVEAQGDYTVTYTSPLAKNQYAEEISGFMRTAEMAINFATATGDLEPLDNFNFDRAIPEIATNLSTPERWMNDYAVKKQIRDQRSAQAERQEMVNAAPAAASVAKAMKEVNG